MPNVQTIHPQNDQIPRYKELPSSKATKAHNIILNPFKTLTDTFILLTKAMSIQQYHKTICLGG